MKIRFATLAVLLLIFIPIACSQNSELEKLRSENDALKKMQDDLEKKAALQQPPPKEADKTKGGTKDSPKPVDPEKPESGPITAQEQKVVSSGQIAFADGRKELFKALKGVRQQNPTGNASTAQGFVRIDFQFFEPIPGDLVFGTANNTINGLSEIRVSIDKIVKIQFLPKPKDATQEVTVKLTYDNGQEKEIPVWESMHAIDVALSDGVITHRYAFRELTGATISFAR